MNRYLRVILDDFKSIIKECSILLLIIGLGLAVTCILTFATLLFDSNTTWAGLTLLGKIAVLFGSFFSVGIIGALLAWWIAGIVERAEQQERHLVQEQFKPKE